MVEVELNENTISNIIEFDKNRKPKKKVIKKEPSESEIQTAFFEWLAIAYPKVREITFAIPNGEFRHIRTAVKLKKTGVLKGCPDIMCPIPNDSFHGLFIEFKSAKGKLSKEQEAIIGKLMVNGYCCQMFNDWIKAKDFLINYLKGTRYAK